MSYLQLQDAARAACAEVGIVFRDVPADGRFHDTNIEGDPHGKGDGRIKLFPDGAGGIAFNWKGDAKSFFTDDGRALSDTERRERDRKRQDAIRQAQEEQTARHAEAAKRAAAIWDDADDATDDHSYPRTKGVKAHGLRIYSGNLVIGKMLCDGAVIVPMRIAGEIHSLQFIAPSGDRRFLSGGRAAGAYYAIGTADEIKARGAICLAEGYATAATIYEATGIASVAAFSAGNLEAVARYLRSRFSGVKIIICGDFDASGTGQRYAAEAAQAVGGIVALPSFTHEELAINKPPSDWNDYAAFHGAEAVREAIEKARQAPQNAVPMAVSDGWPKPQPLTARIESEPYPLDALPGTIRAAVEEVQGFTKSPVPLVASSALAALSLTCQGHINIRRADKLHGPASINLMSIADSGERKSTGDGFFTAPIHDYEAEQAELAKPELDKHRARLAAWEAKRAGMLEAIKAASKQSKATANIERELHQHEQEKPEAPRVPKLLRGDDTPENLAFTLGCEWPSAGVISAEGGIIFGSHGMGSESAMRNMALLNILWDGGTLDVGRRSKESFTVRGARLTLGIQVQGPTLREFFAKSGALARGTGFLARFLFAWPESTQGMRPFTDAPANWPHLAAFNRRIAVLLNQPVPLDADGALNPAMLTLTPDAKAAWVKYHDAIESELASGGELYDVRDVASKSADNAARIAALFHVFEHGTGGAVGWESFDGASRIAAWHLNESRRFFGELALPAELADAARLDSFLIEHCRRKRTHIVGKNYIRQHGPLRDGTRLDAAIRELTALDRLQLLKEGKRLDIHLNPALVGVMP